MMDRPHYCHACIMDCVNAKGFEEHMNGPMHQARMQEMINMHMRKTDQQLARMKAEEHLRKIEGKAKEDYCRICDKRFPGTFVQHRRTQEHRRKERLTKRGCKLCDTGSYQQYPDYVKHIDSESHKKKKEELRRQGSLLGDTDKSSSVDEDRESFADVDSIQDTESCADVDSFPDDLEELVTVDATGIYNEDELEDDEEGLRKTRDNIVVTMTTITANGTCSQTSSQVMQHPNNKSSSLANEISTVKDASDKENQNDGSNKVQTSIQMPIGQEFVIPISGFYCKLCHKFFTKESTATTSHCLSQAHQVKYHKIMELRKQKENGRTVYNAENTMLKANATSTTGQGNKTAKDLRVELVDIKDYLETNNNKSNAVLLDGEDINGAINKGLKGLNQPVSQTVNQVRKRVAFNHKNRIIIIRKQVDDDNETEVEMDSCHDNDRQQAPQDSVAMVTNGQALFNEPKGMDSHKDEINENQDMYFKISAAENQKTTATEVDNTIPRNKATRMSEKV